MRFSFIFTITGSAGLVAAAPAAGPGKRETNIGGIPLVAGAIGSSGSGTANTMADCVQAVIAGVFGAGDFVLNFGPDAANKVASGDITGDDSSFLDNIMKLGGQVPRECLKISTAGGSGISKDMAKSTATKTN